MIFASLLAAATAVNAVSISEFTRSPVSWSYPSGRGFQASSATDAPCGGIASGTRTSYPLTGGQISLTQSTSVDNLNILWYKGDNPTKFHEFSTYTNTIADIGAGHYCTAAPDFSSLGFSAGDEATLLLIYNFNNEETFYYQCADVSLVDASSYVKANYVCGNYTSELTVAGGDDSLQLGTGTANVMGSDMTHPSTGAAAAGTSAAAASKSNAESSSGSGLSAAAGGGIGAGVTIAVIGAILAALYAVGRVHFGKRQVLLSDSASSTNSIMKERV